MVIRNRLVALLYRIVASGIMIWALAINVNSWQSACFFTNQSGMIVAAMMIAMVICNFIDLILHGVNGVAAGIWMPISFAGLTYIVVTGLVFNCYLAPFDTALDNPYTLGSVLAHIAVPLLYVLDWILFEEKGTVKWFHPLYWLIYPVIYGAIMMIRPNIWPDEPLFGSSMYPYPFLNVSEHGWNIVPMLVLMLLGIAAVAYILVVLNNLMAGKYRRRTPKEEE